MGKTVEIKLRYRGGVSSYPQDYKRVFHNLKEVKIGKIPNSLPAGRQVNSKFQKKTDI